ncbi:MAG: hypothetical protein B6I28_05970 [Fusobacteriia bacterium 4572_132]|nr:MAG: hypothetical protein B6I28_05970 [Fusobacteriia bacterium 4572_132]
MTLLTNVLELQEVAFAINKIVNAIDRVTIQTNMLAVNGFVEAAHAGEYGKGFTVVSKDIRNLANDSGENAQKIVELVNTIQRQVANVSQDINESIRHTVVGIKDAEVIAKDVEKVNENTEKLLQQYNKLENTAEEIQEAVSQSKEGAEQIQETSKESLNIAQEISIMSQEQFKAMEEIAEAIEEVAAVADELQS